MTQPTPAPTTPTTDRTGVVIHIAEASAERHQAILRNITNLVVDLDHVTVEVVAHGPGVELLTGESGQSEAVTHVTALGVRFLACGNTLNARELSANDLLDGVLTVPSGVGHLTRRQLQRWAYLRP